MDEFRLQAANVEDGRMFKYAKFEYFKLQAADILVNVNNRNDPFSIIKRWVMGSPYDHVFMYMGKLGILVNRRQRRILNFPMLFESNGRGVVIQSLSNRYSQKVVVMRLKPSANGNMVPRVLEEAVKLASDPQSYYDYFCIVRFVLHRLIYNKLRLPIPLSWHRDTMQICSEAVFEVFFRAGLLLLFADSIVPLPGDFVTDSFLLDEVWRGKLSNKLI